MIDSRLLHHVGIVQPTEADAKALMALLGLEEDYRSFVPQWSALCIFTVAKSGSPIEFVIPDGGPWSASQQGRRRPTSPSRCRCPTGISPGHWRLEA